MNAVVLGTVSKPHGFKGAFVVHSPSGKESSLDILKTIYIGSTAETAVPFSIQEAAWMPRGWKLVVSEVSSETGVTSLLGKTVFGNREELPAPEEGEFYIHDLLGSTVKDVETGNTVGTFVGAEDVGSERNFGQERWWIKSDTQEFSVPATKKFIHQVDLTSRTIYLKDYKELVAS